MKYILALCRHKNFSKAAEACHVSQPSLSNQIQKFEEENRVVLFDRSSKPIGVTHIGQALAQEIEAVFAGVQRMEDLIDGSCQVFRGPFKLGIIPTLSPYLTPMFVQAFSNRFPELEITIEEMKTQTILHQLDRGELDVALLAAPKKEVRKYGQISLFHEPFYVLASSGHPLCEKEHVDEAELDARQVWLMAEGHCLREQVISLCGRRIREEYPQKRVQFSSTSLETLVNMTRNHEGYTLIPYLAATNLSKDLKEAGLRSLASPCPSRKIALVFNQAYPKKGLLEALAEIIKAAVPATLHFRRDEAIRILDVAQYPDE